MGKNTHTLSAGGAEGAWGRPPFWPASNVHPWPVQPHPSRV